MLLIADNLIKGAHHTPMSPLVKGERIFDICSSALFLFRWVALPVIRTGEFSTLFSVRNAISNLAMLWICWTKSTETGKTKVSKVAGQSLDCYCVCSELLSASIADALLFVNMVCLPLIAEQNGHEICPTQECLQIIRRLLWKQTTTHSLRNNNPMFDGNLWPNSFDQPFILG